MSHQFNAHTLLRIIGSASLLLLPVVLGIAFSLHFHSVSDFFDFKLIKPEYSVETLLNTLTSADEGFRFFVLPHTVGFLAVPFYIPAALALAYVQYKQAPMHAVIGALFTSIGAIFMAGVFAIWLSFASVSNVPADMVANILPVLTALTAKQGTLLFTTIMSGFTFVGLFVLGFGLLGSKLNPRWATILYLIGNGLIAAFLDLDNWMLIGAVLMTIGMMPLAKQLITNKGVDCQTQTACK